MGLIYSCLKREGDPTSNLARRATNSTSADEDNNKKQYSWDQREEKDAANFMIENRQGEELGKIPGEIKGEQFIVRNCEDCSIYLLDHINTISIDDCKRCKFYIGPVKASLFVRDCSDISMVAACGQFRTRDCRNIQVFLCCSTQPIIEATIKAKFGCFQYSYPELLDQFSSAGISPFNNLWWNVHDFTPVQGEQNWGLIGECYKVHDFISDPDSDPLKQRSASADSALSVVPQTLGSRKRDHDEISLIAVFSVKENEEQTELEKRAFTVLKEMEKCAEIDLVKSRNLLLERAEAERIFPHKDDLMRAKKGNLVGLQFGGPDCINQCKRVADSLTESLHLPTGSIFASLDSEKSLKDVQNLFNQVDMQLGI